MSLYYLLLGCMISLSLFFPAFSSAQVDRVKESKTHPKATRTKDGLLGDAIRERLNSIKMPPSVVQRNIDYIIKIINQEISKEDLIATATATAQNPETGHIADLLNLLGDSDSQMRRMANKELKKMIRENNTKGYVFLSELFSLEIQMLLFNNVFLYSHYPNREKGHSLGLSLSILRELARTNAISRSLNLILLDQALYGVSESMRRNAISILERTRTLDNHTQEVALQIFFDTELDVNRYPHLVDESLDFRQKVLRMVTGKRAVKDKMRDIITQIMINTKLSLEAESLLVKHFYHPVSDIRNRVHRILFSEHSISLSALQSLSQSLFKKPLEVDLKATELLIRHLEEKPFSAVKQEVFLKEKATKLLIRQFKLNYYNEHKLNEIYLHLIEKLKDPDINVFIADMAVRILLSRAKTLGPKAQKELVHLFRSDPDFPWVLIKNFETLFQQIPKWHIEAKNALLELINHPDTKPEYRKIATQVFKPSLLWRLKKCATAFRP